ncbi:MAG TPA: hypothetical protein VFX64_01985 [Candidatus Nitrosotalea sp.]|nr:hypothetical protein [Candidatus Nitrosotalea sp.]
MNLKRKQIYVSAITLIATVAVCSIVFNGQFATANLHTTDVIDYTGDVKESKIMIQKGHTIVIPVSIMSPKEKAYDLKVGITSTGNETMLAIADKANMPKGISASIDKKIVNLQATTEKGIAQRDSVNVTITVSPDAKVGTYPLSLVLSRDLGNGMTSQSTTYLHIDVGE